MTNEIVYGVLFIAAVLLAILFVSVWLLPGYFASKYKSRYQLAQDLDIAKLESDTRTAMVQLAVGLAGFTVLLTAIHSIGATNRNIDLATQGQLAERFSRAVALVSEEENGSADGEDGSGGVDPGFVARVGGAYALDGIVAAGGDDYLNPTIHVLAAMIRRESPRGDHNSSCAELNKVLKENPDVNPYAAPAIHKILEPDVQAALKVIQRRAASGSALAGELDLSHADLCIAFLHGARFAGVQLRNSDLRGAILDHADLTRAALSGADLTGTHLPGAKLEGAILWETKLEQSDLSCADLSEADMKGAMLTDANLSGANLTSAKNLTPDQLSKACYSKGATHPLLASEQKHLKVKECGRESVWHERFEPLYQQACPPAMEGGA